MGVKLSHAEFQPSTPRGTFSNWGLNIYVYSPLR